MSYNTFKINLGIIVYFLSKLMRNKGVSFNIKIMFRDI